MSESRHEELRAFATEHYAEHHIRARSVMPPGNGPSWWRLSAPGVAACTVEIVAGLHGSLSVCDAESSRAWDSLDEDPRERIAKAVNGGWDEFVALTCDHGWSPQDVVLLDPGDDATPDYYYAFAALARLDDLLRAEDADDE